MVYLIAHRGASALAPENTLCAFRMAKEKGADWVEFDVMLTQDEVAVVFHDETLDRTTNGTGLISEHTLAQIKALDAGEWFNKSFKKERIPTLEETINLLIALDLNANIEIKPCGDTVSKTTKTVLDIIKKNWPQHKPTPFLSSFNLQCLELACSEAPTYPRGLLLDEWREDCCMLAAKYKCMSINLAYRVLTKERIDQMKAAGFLIAAYTVNQKERASHLAQLGVDMIISDHVELLKQMSSNSDKSLSDLICSKTYF